MSALVADPESPDDATRFSVRVYDLLAFTLDPHATVPLSEADIDPRCGTFSARNIPIPAQGLLLLVADDLDNPVDDALAPTGVPFSALPGLNLTNIEIAAVTREQVQNFSDAIGEPSLTAAGCPPSADLAACGTWIGLYRRGQPDDPGEPLEGVIPQGPTADLPAEVTFYPGIDPRGHIVFDNPNPGTTWSDDQGPHEWTGLTGAVFSPALTAGNVSGRCAPQTPCELAGCVWFTAVGGAIPGLLTVQFIWPVTCTAR